MLSLNHSYQTSNKAPRNITFRNTAFPRASPCPKFQRHEGKMSRFWKVIKELLLQAKLQRSCNELWESAGLTVFLWLWVEKVRALLALSVVQRPPLVHALSVNKEAKKSNPNLHQGDSLLMMGPTIISCTEPSFLFSVPFIHLTCVFLSLPQSSLAQDFP